MQLKISRRFFSVSFYNGMDLQFLILFKVQYQRNCNISTLAWNQLLSQSHGPLWSNGNANFILPSVNWLIYHTITDLHYSRNLFAEESAERKDNILWCLHLAENSSQGQGAIPQEAEEEMPEMFATVESQEQMLSASISQHSPIDFIASLRSSLPQFTHVAINKLGLCT